MKKNQYFNSASAKGVTLIELAIVIMVIGLVIGSVLAGKELVRQSKVGSQIAQFGYFKSAIDRFKERYGCIPGDYNEAVRVLGAVNEGNCDKKLGNNGVGSDEEDGGFWEQLSLSKLINETYAYTAPGCDTAPYGVQCPATKYGKNLNIMAEYLSLGFGPAVYGAGNGLSVNDGAVASWVAKAIDVKMDDGQPHYGNIISMGSLCMVDDKTYDLRPGEETDCKLTYFFETPSSSW